MNDFNTTLKELKTRGYYYMEFRPTVFKEDLVGDLTTMRTDLERAKISLRGWPFPLIPSSDKEFAQIYNANDHIESWVLVYHYLEVWRYYKSGLFIDYNAFSEDWYKESEFLEGTHFKKIEPNKWLDIISAIYEITEMILFASRLAKGMESVNEFYLRLLLHNVKGRKLVTFDPARASLSMDYICKVDQIPFERTLSRKEVIENPVGIAKEIILKVCEQFNWVSVSEKLIDDEQAKLIARNL